MEVSLGSFSEFDMVQAVAWRAYGKQQVQDRNLGIETSVRRKNQAIQAKQDDQKVENTSPPRKRDGRYVLKGLVMT